MKKKILGILKSKKFIKKYNIGYILENDGKKITIVANNVKVLKLNGLALDDLVIIPMKNIPKNSIYFILGRISGTGRHPREEEMKKKLEANGERGELDNLDKETEISLNAIVYEATILGEVYSSFDTEKVVFSNMLSSLNAPLKYHAFIPNESLLDLILNGLVDGVKKRIGEFAGKSEKFKVSTEKIVPVDVKVLVWDFIAKKTAFFGQSRMGKTNTAIMLIQIIEDMYGHTGIIGQLLFDMSGEFSNNNSQNEMCFVNFNKERCKVYSHNDNEKNEENVKYMHLNFYQDYLIGQEMLRDLIVQKDSSQYIKSFFNVELPTINIISKLYDEYHNLKKNSAEWYIARRKYSKAYAKLLLFWCALKKSGFKITKESEIIDFPLEFFINAQVRNVIDKKNKELAKNRELLDRQGILKDEYTINITEENEKLDDVVNMFQILYDLNKESKLKSTSGDFFDNDDMRLLKFIFEQAGCDVLASHKHLHKEDGRDFIEEIKEYLNDGKIVIIKLNGMQKSTRKYFSEIICEAIFHMREKIFVKEKERKYVQIYFEEAHNLFPAKSKDLTNIYARIAKEGAKLGIGFFYTTQSPSSISEDLLNETNNLFVSHLSSRLEIKNITRHIAKYEGLEDHIIKNNNNGYSYILTQSNKFVIPCQVADYNAFIKERLKLRGDTSGI